MTSKTTRAVGLMILASVLLGVGKVVSRHGHYDIATWIESAAVIIAFIAGVIGAEQARKWWRS